MSDTSPANYKLLIHATLVQQSAFSTGGNRYDDKHPELDHVLAKNGNGDYTLRGTGLAGAFIATAHKLYSHLPQTISENTPQEQQKVLDDQYKKYKKKGEKAKQYSDWLQEQPRMNESLWIFHHAHPLNTPQDSEIRDNVAIRQKTGAAKDGAKFDSETLPAGTRWNFLMEVDQYRDVIDCKADSIALNVIKHWQQHGCWLGKDVARGLGLMKLTDLKVYQLTTEHVSRWPDSNKTPCEPLQGLHSSLLPETDKTHCQKQKAPDKTPCFLTGSITLEVGQNSDGYGLDMLSVGGNNNKDNHVSTNYPEQLQKKNFLNQHKNKLLTPLGQNKDIYLTFDKGKQNTEDNDIDFSLATTQTTDGKIVPYIPGSSIRGPLRHTLSWLLRKQGKKIWEPAGENNYPDEETAKKDIVLKLFGSTQQSAKLLISDAMPVNDNWQAVVLEMHAEDEFTQGAYSSSKFDHTCLIKGEFKARFLLEAEDQTELKTLKQQLETLQTLGEQQMIPIGSGQWKGMGWIKLKLKYDGIADDCPESQPEKQGAAA